MNVATLLLAGVFCLPILSGVLSASWDRVGRSLRRYGKRLTCLFTLALAFLGTRGLFSHARSPLWQGLYRTVPALEASVTGQDIWLFLLVLLGLWVVLNSLGEIVCERVLSRMLQPAARAFRQWWDRQKGAAKRALSGLVQLPRAAALVLSFAMLLHLYVAFAKNSELGAHIEESAAYRAISGSVLEPVLDSAPLQQAPAYLVGLLDKAVENTSLSRLPSVTYMNGMTLRAAVEGSEEIDRLAQELTRGLETDREKAYALYAWISSSIRYDYEKVALLQEAAVHAASGAVEAYYAGKGVCFDYACLYVSMCRAAGLSVRFVAGQGYGSGGWEPHAWNQVYDAQEDRWLPVDATFGSAGGDHFDSEDFETNHAGARILGEW